jgi:hypothetical protein
MKADFSRVQLRSCCGEFWRCYELSSVKVHFLFCWWLVCRTLWPSRSFCRKIQTVKATSKRKFSSKKSEVNSENESSFQCTIQESVRREGEEKEKFPPFLRKSWKSLHRAELRKSLYFLNIAAQYKTTKQIEQTEITRMSIW